MTEKANYVRRQRQNRNHTCHWTGCTKQCPPAMWGCKPHWFRLPKHLRDDIWLTYEIGQEVSMTPSDEYLDAAHAVAAWIDDRITECQETLLLHDRKDAVQLVCDGWKP